MSERKFTYNLGRIESDDTQLSNFYIQHRGKSYGNPTNHWLLVLGEIMVTFHWAKYEHQDDGRVKIVIGNVSSNRGRERDNVSGKYKTTFVSREEQDDIISLFVEAMNAAFKSNVSHPSKPRPFNVNTVMSDDLQNRLNKGNYYKPHQDLPNMGPFIGSRPGWPGKWLYYGNLKDPKASVGKMVLLMILSAPKKFLLRLFVMLSPIIGLTVLYFIRSNAGV